MIYYSAWCLHYVAPDNCFPLHNGSTIISTIRRTRVAGGRDNVQELLHGQRERFAAEIQHAGSGGGIEKLGGRHQEPDPYEKTALRGRRSRLFLLVFHGGTYIKMLRRQYYTDLARCFLRFPRFDFAC